MKRADWLFVGALLLLAAGLRLIGVTYGQPSLVYDQRASARGMVPMELPIHPDEFLFVVRPLNMLVTGQLNPKFFHNPSFLINLNFVTFWLTGADQQASPADWPGTNERTHAPFPLYIIGRLYSALGGVLAVAATYAAGRRLGGPFAAAVAGLLTAAALPLVQHAHYTTTSSLATGFTMAAIWAGFAALRAGRWRWPLLMLAGSAVGLAAGSRYNAAAVLIVVFLAGLVLLYRERTRRALLLIVTAWLLAPLTFLVTTPHLLFDTEFFLSEFRYITSQYLGGVDVQFPVTAEHGLLLNLRYLALFGVGAPAAALAFVGLYAAGSSRPRRQALLASTTSAVLVGILLVYILAYALVNLRTVRVSGSDSLILILIPAVALLSGLGAAGLAEIVRLPRRVLMPGLALLAVTVPLVSAVQMTRQFSQPDTRRIMQSWVYEHLPRGAAVHLNGPYNVPLDPLDYPWAQNYGGDLLPLAAIQAEGADYMILSDAWYHDVLRSPEMTTPAYLQTVRAYLASFETLPVIVRIERPVWTGYDWLNHMPSYWHNPGLTIYCLNPAACAAVR